MNTPEYFDVVVAKEYESRGSGAPEMRTKWNRIGRAWTAKSGESLNFELFLIPNQRYVIRLKQKDAFVSETRFDEEMPTSLKEVLL